MKTSFSLILRAGVVAAALTFAGAASATASLTATQTELGKVVYAGTTTGIFGKQFETVGAWNVTEAGASFWAYCIDPLVSYDNVSNNYTTSSFAASTSEQRLFDYFYATSLTSNTSSAAFQLALWELQNQATPDLSSGTLSFTAGAINGQGAVSSAASMLSFAMGDAALKNLYSYTSYTSAGLGAESQTLLRVAAVSAVPEPTTWTMLAAGLGLIGFMSRRRKSV